MNREKVIATLLKSYQAFYNITSFDNESGPLVARCDFFEESQKYVISKKAELWSSKAEEFLYLYSVDTLTKEIFEECKKNAYEDGSGMANIGPNHMYTYITTIFICDHIESDAKKALKKARIYKSFHFSFYGWLEYHAAVLSCTDDKITTNYAGRSIAKILKKVLFTKTK